MLPQKSGECEISRCWYDVVTKGAGTTYVFAKLLNGKGEAKCKVIVTDGNDYKFTLILTDKGKSDFSIGNPQAFLSQKAIEKRLRRNIPIDESDLPKFANSLSMGGVFSHTWLFQY